MVTSDLPSPWSDRTNTANKTQPGGHPGPAGCGEQSVFHSGVQFPATPKYVSWLTAAELETFVPRNQISHHEHTSAYIIIEPKSWEQHVWCSAFC